MPRAKLSNGSIAGIVTAIPSTIRRIDDEAGAYGDPAQVERIKKTIGLNERRVVEPGVTTLDLCETAARQLFDRVPQNMEETDGVVFVTQTPDHFQPSNAAVLHGRLRLKTDCASFDVNLGCSGYVYGLYVAQLLLAGGCSQVLLLAGDTLSRCVHPRDRAVAPLFGDAGSATLLIRDPKAEEWTFDLHTNGAGANFITIPAGGFREPKSEQTSMEATDESGNTRTPENLFMDGAEVFNFSIKVEPAAVKEALAYAETSVEEIDAFIFHQANRYIISNIARRLKIPAEKAPATTVEKYGNQSSASIPATLCDALGPRVSEDAVKVCLSGFGVGLSWATAIGRLHPMACCEIVER